jgi:hypothetical protein
MIQKSSLATSPGSYNEVALALSQCLFRTVSRDTP